MSVPNRGMVHYLKKRNLPFENLSDERIVEVEKEILKWREMKRTKRRLAKKRKRSKLRLVVKRVPSSWSKLMIAGRCLD